MRKALSIQNKDIFKAIHRSQHCQRNWDLDSEIPQEDIDIILEAVTQCPSKQNRDFYKVHIVQDRKTIEQIHDATQGFVLSRDQITTNTQVLAHLCLVFEEYTDPEIYKQEYIRQLINMGKYTGSIDQMDNEEALMHVNNQLQRDSHMAIGVAAGYANLTASLLGYSSGCCACFNPAKVGEILNTGNPMLIMGIGIPGSKNRRIHHVDETIKFPTLKKRPIEVVTH